MNAELVMNELFEKGKVFKNAQNEVKVNVKRIDTFQIRKLAGLSASHNVEVKRSGAGLTVIAKLIE